MNMGIVDYSKIDTPPGYKCSKCGATGVKLWREYQTFADCTELLCACCVSKQAKENIIIDSDGLHYSKCGIKTDSIDWYVPAVPTVEGDTFWGYTSVPELGVTWWRRLPNVK